MFVVHKSLACPLKFAIACSCLNDIPKFSDLSLVYKEAIKAQHDVGLKAEVWKAVWLFMDLSLERS